MGYRLAGYDVLGFCEIDPVMAGHYRRNLRPRLEYVMDIREFRTLPDLPPELFDLDLLDGSPPCSVFSMLGQRENNWGKERRFAEGTVLQSLDDLFLEFVALADRLRPRVVLAENVMGLAIGAARGYVNDILKRFDKAGYDVQMFVLNAARMSVPQFRRRLFFVCRRRDLGLPPLALCFDEPPISFGMVRSEAGERYKSEYARKVLSKKIRTDKRLSDIIQRLYGRTTGFSHRIFWDDEIAPTIDSSSDFYRAHDDCRLSRADLMACQTFPENYDFGNTDLRQIQYVCGMSVPPLMTKRIAAEIYRQWFGK